MKTVKRIFELECAVDCARNGKTDIVVADIATDHGYLAEALHHKDWTKKVIASDISKKCLNKVIKLAKQRNLDKIETVVGDGLMPIEIADVAVIAGVGGWEIIKILSEQNKNEAGTRKCDIFILQPAQNVIELRSWIFDNQIFVVQDYVIEDAERFYPIIIVDVSKKQINEKSVFNLRLGRDNDVSSQDFVLFLKDSLSFLEFLKDLPTERIEQDEILKEKFELKNIIEKLLEK